MQRIVCWEKDAERLELIPSFPLLVGEDWKSSIDWQQKSIRMFGRMIPEPRLTAWYGPPYTYSGVSMPGRPLPAPLVSIRDQLSEFTGFAFNSVLCNCYRHGHDAMGWHSDDEKEMDPACIASLSFGAARHIHFRDREKSGKIKLLMPDHSLLLMWHMQQNWQHALPRVKGLQEARINLTFRRIR